MKIRPNKTSGKNQEMSIDQQIKQCEEKIADLEHWKRAMVSGELDQKQMKDYQGTLEKDLDRAYEQITLLKIRKMMGF